MSSPAQTSSCAAERITERRGPRKSSGRLPEPASAPGGPGHADGLLRRFLLRLHIQAHYRLQCIPFPSVSSTPALATQPFNHSRSGTVRSQRR